MLRYWLDTSVSPFALELYGFPDGPLAGMTMFGIVEVNGDMLRVDFEPGPGGAANNQHRPTAFSDRTLSLHRVRT